MWRRRFGRSHSDHLLHGGRRRSRTYSYGGTVLLVSAGVLLILYLMGYLPF